MATKRVVLKTRVHRVGEPGATVDLDAAFADKLIGKGLALTPQQAEDLATAGKVVAEAEAKAEAAKAAAAEANDKLHQSTRAATDKRKAEREAALAAKRPGRIVRETTESDSKTTSGQMPQQPDEEA